MSLEEYVVEIADVYKEYKMGKVTIPALQGISFKIYREEYVSIMGPSGSGKSTLFNVIGGLDTVTSGEIYIDQVDIAELDAYELAWLRNRKIGYIFQTFNLLLAFTAQENVETPMVFAGRPREERRKRSREILELVGLGDRLKNKPGQLSGGQQQRVAIARALANDPAIVLADEPTANLDLVTGLEIIELLRKLNEEQGTTIITATHDLKMINISDRIIWVRDGRVDRIEDRTDVQVSAIS
ncbi:MAG: ABC transporter ATP-binding protein [Candidatus Heimdallarchaeota archaeon]|nr:MAG: ABC transporter ATP-binding protein [Candidatus Heimdallarchaeota archaeon]